MMDSQARHELSRALRREGAVLVENPQRIKALLMDTCPESRTEIGLLVQAAEDDIPTRLARSSESVFRDSEIAGAVADLKKTRRLDDGAAEWVVRSWAWALGVLDTEPSDDVGDTATATPTFLSTGQGGSAPYPSSPLSGPGDATSFPPAESGSRAGTSPYSEPWKSGVTAGGQSASRDTGGPPWVSPPPGQATGSWGGVPLPAKTEGDAASPTPPSGRRWGRLFAPRGRLFVILGAVAVVIVLAVVGVVILHNPGPSATSPPADSGPDTINFTIMDSLVPSLEVAETATVYSFGRKIGSLEISTSQPNASLPMSAAGTDVDIQLEITLIATDGTQHTFNGTGAITVYEGATYAVDIGHDSAGTYWATLVPKQSGT